jgi:23S rRNA pseudouridine1911/1915/1917 synthase
MAMLPAEDTDRLQLTVELDHTGLRLDQCLTALLPGRSRSQLQRLIREGRVLVDGRPARASHEVRPGMILDVTVPAIETATPRPQDLPLEILHEDRDLIVVNKPAGQVVHPAAGHAEGTLVNALLHHVTDLSGIGGERRPGIVHRLDRGTSGVMVVAKHDAAHIELSRQFHDREVEKAYIALVWGLVHAGRRIDAAIGRDPSTRQRMSTRARRARAAVTRITGARHFPGVTLATVAIATGRTHQIRVHLQAIGHPIVGDSVYGGVRRRLPPHLKALGSLTRPFLHAAHLAFRHPGDGTQMSFECPLPGDLQDVLSRLEAAAARHLDDGAQSEE